MEGTQKRGPKDRHIGRGGGPIIGSGIVEGRQCHSTAHSNGLAGNHGEVDDNNGEDGKAGILERGWPTAVPWQELRE